MITLWEVNCDLGMVHNKEMYWECSPDYMDMDHVRVRGRISSCAPVTRLPLPNSKFQTSYIPRWHSHQV